MWTLYNKAKLYSRLPSELLRIGDEWTAYQLDNAVTMLGITIENALQERRNTGSDKAPQWEQRYSLAQLLDDAFRLPAPAQERTPAGLAGLIGLPGVKVIKAKG